jgi:hypothetical protein
MPVTGGVLGRRLDIHGRYIMTRGMSYFYNDLRQAEAYFSDAIRVAQHLPANASVGRATATAYHCLARIMAADKDWRGALDFMTQGRDSANTTRGGEAYYHLRLAEVRSKPTRFRRQGTT